MTFTIDGERLEAWLTEQQASLIQSARERHAADGADDHTALRMDGGVASMGVVLSSLHNFTVGATRRTPIDDIAVDARLKVRKRDPGTSWEAASGQSSEHSRKLYRAIYILLSKVGPMTDHELRNEMTRRSFDFGSEEGVTKRRGELVEAGWVQATKERRKSQHGKNMIVWEALPEEL
jgi:hypothetical protein